MCSLGLKRAYVMGQMTMADNSMLTFGRLFLSLYKGIFSPLEGFQSLG